LGKPRLNSAIFKASQTNADFMFIGGDHTEFAANATKARAEKNSVFTNDLSATFKAEFHKKARGIIVSFIGNYVPVLS